MKTKKYFIWDFDGTLFNSYPIMNDAIYNVIKQNNILNVDFQTVEHLTLKSVKAVFDHYKPNMSFDEFQEQWKSIESQNLDAILPFNFAYEILNLVKSTKGKNYIYTHRDYNSLIFLLNKYNLSNLFEDIICAENRFPKKPNPLALQHLLQKRHINSNESLMIGDRTIDIRVAQNANIDSVFISQTNTDINYSYQFYNLKDFYYYLSKISKP